MRQHQCLDIGHKLRADIAMGETGHVPCT